jgi:hypothetical protein
MGAAVSILDCWRLWGAHEIQRTTVNEIREHYLTTLCERLENCYGNEWNVKNACSGWCSPIWFALMWFKTHVPLHSNIRCCSCFGF